MEVLSHVFLRAYESSSIYFNRLWNGCVIFLRQETNGVFVLVNWRINWNWNWQFHCTFFLFVQRANDKRIILVDIFSPELSEYNSIVQVVKTSGSWWAIMQKFQFFNEAQKYISYHPSSYFWFIPYFPNKPS